MPAPSYRLQNEQVGHLQALPGGLRVQTFVHEMSGFGSVDVWCRYFCEEFTREEKRGKMKSQKVEYVCGQCARLSDFDLRFR